MLEGIEVSIKSIDRSVMIFSPIFFVTFSILGLLDELQPVLHGTPLEFDLNALASGLDILHQFKNYLIEEDIRGNSKYFNK